jgi:hypothetical protein
MLPDTRTVAQRYVRSLEDYRWLRITLRPAEFVDALKREAWVRLERAQSGTDWPEAWNRLHLTGCE